MSSTPDSQSALAEKEPASRRRRPKARQPGLQEDRREAAPGARVLAADLMAQLQKGGAARASALNTLQQPGLVRSLGFQQLGCRVVQLALDLAERQDAVRLAQGLRGHIVEAIKSPHCNYVVQKFIKVLSPQEAEFVVREIADARFQCVRHEYGCRILCRLLEHSGAESGMARILDRVLAEAEDLIKDQFGHYVMESVLEHGAPHHRQRIVAALQASLTRGSLRRNAAYVLEKAIWYGTSEDRVKLATGLLALPRHGADALAWSQGGGVVLRAISQLPEPWSGKVREHLRSAGIRAGSEAWKPSGRKGRHARTT
uniref:PUM-HD domain-containing protein n=1 Tax=Zooxanthella nutricula TaxID=1333877 RepID=A0A7S2NAJ3_9DINO